MEPSQGAGDGPATVRMLLCEAAWQAVRRSPSMKAFFERVMHGEPGRKKIALVAAAHKLARSMAAMLRTGEACRAVPKRGTPAPPRPLGPFAGFAALRVLCDGHRLRRQLGVQQRGGRGLPCRLG